MSSITTNPSLTADRAQVLAEAVVSAYIREIAPPQRWRERIRDDCTERVRVSSGRSLSR
jgi:hypothetical protein